jgi:hypothetical protein
MAESFVFSEFITKGKISNDAAAALEKEELDNYQALMDFSEHFEQGSPGLGTNLLLEAKSLIYNCLTVPCSVDFFPSCFCSFKSNSS